ncbi:cytochrome P450 [Xylaria acuta]|nr:cytochrome P450 [Xylaria acuta]
MAWYQSITPMSAALTALAVALLAGLGKFYADSRRHIPGPPIARLTPIWLWYISWRGIECTVLARLHEKYGPVVRIAPNEVDISDGIAVPTIYVKNGGFPKSPMYRNVDINGFATIFSVLDPAHRALRAKAVAPLFAQQRLVQGRPPVQKAVDAMVTELIRRKHESHGRPVDVLNLFRSMFIDCVAISLLGESFNGIGKERLIATDYVDAFASGGRFFLLPGWIFHLVEPWARKLHKNQSGIDKSTQHVQNFATRLVDRHISGEQGASGTYHGRLLNAGVSREETIAQVMDILFAGTDGTGRTFAVLTQYLAEHSKVYEKAREEIINNPDGEAHSLPYLSAIVKESLRLAQANPTRLPRTVPEGGLHVPGLPSIPAGTSVGVSAHNLHLNAKVFSEPRQFVPERWINPSSDMIRDSFYFGQGPRQCIARNLASIMLCWGAEALIRSDVLRGAKPVKGNSEMYQWFNAVSCSGKNELVWEQDFT